MKYPDETLRRLRVGFSSYTDNDTVLEINGNVGIGTTNATSELWVNGDGYFTGIVTAHRIISEVLTGTNIVGTSLSISGISTLSGPVNINNDLNITGFLTGTNASFSGNVSVAGTLTYEDVTNVDSIGLITARSGVRISSGGLDVIGVSTFNDRVEIKNTLILDQLQVAGISTFTNGPVFIGSGTSTGTTNQKLQVTGGAYVSGNLGIGTTNPQTKLEIDGILGFSNTYFDPLGRINIRIGDKTTGANLTGGYNNIFMGVGAGNSTTTGPSNNFFGYKAGYFNTTGSANNFFGYYAGYNNIDGSANNFFGICAGCCNTSGDSNNFFGYRAGQYNTTGRFNIFFGDRAGISNISGWGNIFFGKSSGFYSCNGYYNTFFGLQSGALNTTGSYNNFFGGFAGYCNTIGSYNNFLGQYSGYCNTTGYCNNAFGIGAGYCNQTGNRNNFFGNYTGISTSASNKIIIGSGKQYNQLFDSPDTTKDLQFAVGVRTDANPSKYWIVGNENFNIGIGTTNPQTKLEIDGILGFSTFSYSGTTFNNIRIGDKTTGANLTSGVSNIFMGVGAGNSTTTGNGNNFLGYQAGQYNITGFLNTFLGNQAGRYNTTGYDNNFFGNSAGYCNTIGTNNNFFGDSAGGCNTCGNNNNFFGTAAGFCNITGSSNNFLGCIAGYNNTTGCNNNFFGNFAGCSNTSGSYNSFFGCASGFNNNIGSCNNFFGLYSGYFNTTGNCNNAFGVEAGNCNQTGNKNNFFGNYTGVHTSTSYRVVIGEGLSYNTAFDVPKNADVQFAVGVRTDANPSKYWIVGNENFNIGIGTTNPTTKLQVGGVLGFGGRNNVKIGDNTTGAVADDPGNTNAVDNVFIGVGAGNSSQGGYNVYLGKNAGVDGGYGAFNFFGGYRAGFGSKNANNNVFIGSGAGAGGNTGYKNNFIGYYAGYNNTTGGNNNFFGCSAGSNNTTGSCNNFFGMWAGYYNTTGSCNNFFGVEAGNFNQTGNKNNFFGNYTGVHTSTSYRVVIGEGLSYNTAFDVPKNADTQFAIGIRTDANESKYWIVGNENFNIGIGTTNPTEKLTVGGNILVNDTTLQGSFKTTTSTTSPVGIHSTLPIATYRSVEYTIQVTEGSNFHATKILALHDGSSAYLTEYGTIYNNASVSGFNVDVSGGNLRLLAIPASASTTDYTINFIATKI